MGKQEVVLLQLIKSLQKVFFWRLNETTIPGPRELLVMIPSGSSLLEMQELCLSEPFSLIFSTAEL